MRNSLSIEINGDWSRARISRLTERSFGQAIHQSLDGDIIIRKANVDFSQKQVPVLHFVFEFGNVIRRLEAFRSSQYEWPEGEGTISLSIDGKSVILSEVGAEVQINTSLGELKRAFSNATLKFWKELHLDNDHFFQVIQTMWYSNMREN